MLDKIEKLLRGTPKIKARNIAKTLNAERSEVSKFLHDNQHRFSQNSEYEWSLVDLPEIRINLPGDSWTDCDAFERALAVAGSPLELESSAIIFIVPKGCKILLEAAARVMALCNQLALMNKKVSIDFADSPATLSYLNRMGFFDFLSDDVNVSPRRPNVSGAVTFKGNNDKVVEFGGINPEDPDESIPEQLKRSFVAHASEKYATPVFTVLSELFGNVRDHSESPIPGFTALQCYTHGIKPHIQIVISDSGKGIVGTLRPVLATRYPLLAEKFKSENPAADALLVKEVLECGNISQSNEDGRGLGLKRSNDVAVKFNAKISVRQESFEILLDYRGGVLRKFSHTLNKPKILGTHICFDFFLDSKG